MKFVAKPNYEYLGFLHFDHKFLQSLPKIFLRFLKCAPELLGQCATTTLQEVLKHKSILWSFLIFNGS